MIITTRLHKDADLKQSIQEICQANNVHAGIILSSVGCLQKLHIRLAKALEDREYIQDFEILSINGTCSMHHSHLHICVADDQGNTIGGHLLDGCIINTTCELTILSMDDREFIRELENDTGYQELVILER